MNEEKVILERHKPTDFIVNYENKRVVWRGSKGKMLDRKEVNKDLFDYLAMSTKAISDGALVISDKAKNKSDILDELVDREAYEANALTKEETIKLLRGKFEVMKSNFDKVTSTSTKTFIYEVAKEIKLESAKKQKYIKEMLGSELSTEELFDEE